MALRGTLTHRKNRRLAQILGIQLPGALGYVEALLHVTAEHAPTGNIGRLSNRDIAEEMFYTLDPDELIAAFVASEWLERSDQHRLIVHHWSKHSDDTTDVKLARHGNLYADGSRPRMSRLSNAERATLCAKYGWLEHIKPQEATLCHNVALPVPEPETVPENKTLLPTSAPTRPNGVNGANALAEGDLLPAVQENQADPPPPAKASQKTSDAKVSQQQAWFNEWWAQYWRKDDKKPAWKAFRKYIHTEKHYERMLAAFRRASPEMLHREKSLRPMGASWLNKEPWEDGEDDSPPRVVDIQSGRMPPASSTNGHRQNLPPAAGWREL